MKRIGLHHWVIVLTIAIAAHAALLVRFTLNDTIRTADTGAAGVRIALAPTQGEPQPEQVAADAAEQQDEPAQQEPEPKPEPTPEPEPTPAPEPEPTPEPEPEPTPVPEPKPKPQPKPEPKPQPKPEPKPQPKPKPRPEPERREQPQTATASTSARRDSNARPAGGQDRNNAPAKAPQTAATTQQGTTGSVSDTPPDYRAELGAWLQRYKDYPRRARRLRQEGTVLLYFVMDRNGHVLDWEIRQSSGHELLDEAVRDMIRKADPLPALPASVSMQRLALTVPVRFQLR
ncbi:TonB family protein [Salinisphaera sp. S4-8]|uniref:energy transducer TonB n=1 Tax=Salinisphaera sp. S4-8 TaxID=633357 RepID=UPI00333EEC31